MSLIWRYISRYNKLFLVNVLGAFGFVFVELGLPTMLARLINETVAGGGKENILRTTVFMVGLVLIGFVGRVIVAYATGRITTNMVADMRNDMYQNIQTFSHEEYDRIGVSSLVTRVTNDAFILMQFAQMLLRMGLMTFIMMFASAFMIARTSPELSVILLPAFPALLVMILVIGKKSQPLSEAQQQNLDDINGNLRESLSGMRVIRAFVKEAFQAERFEGVNNAYSLVSKKLFRLMAWNQPVFSHVINLIIIAIVWFGSEQIEGGSLQLGDMTAFIEYSFHALFSFLNFAVVFMMYPRASVSAKRIQEVLDTTSSISPNEAGITETRTRGYLTFEAVSFAYPGNTGTPVIKDISFSAEPGQTIAFIGSTGSGKSTLIQLIPRFYDVTKGRILIDGHDVRDYNLKALRKKSVLFHRKLCFSPERYLKIFATGSGMPQKKKSKKRPIFPKPKNSLRANQNVSMSIWQRAEAIFLGDKSSVYRLPEPSSANRIFIYSMTASRLWTTRRTLSCAHGSKKRPGKQR